MKKEIKGQNPIDFDKKSEFWGLVEQIGHVMYMRMKEKNSYGKERLTDYIDSLLMRFEIVREATLYKFVPNSFIYKAISCFMEVMM